VLPKLNSIYLVIFDVVHRLCIGPVFLTWNEFSINHLNYSKYRNCRNDR